MIVGGELMDGRTGRGIIYSLFNEEGGGIPSLMLSASSLAIERAERVESIIVCEM